MILDAARRRGSGTRSPVRYNRPPDTRSNGSANELCVGQFGTIEIAPCDTVATDIKLACHADRDWLAVAVENVESACWQSGARSAWRRHAGSRANRRPDRGFGRPIHVPQLAAGAIEQTVRRGSGQGFAARNRPKASLGSIRTESIEHCPSGGVACITVRPRRDRFLLAARREAHLISRLATTTRRTT